MTSSIYNDIEEFWAAFMKAAFDPGEGGPEKIFRGLTNTKHSLKPSIGRGTKDGTIGVISTLERNLLEDFKRLSLPELTSLPENEFEWLFLAQHYGLPTRLLDWSSNPLVALFFASERNDDVNGAVYFVRHATSDQYEIFDYQTADYTQDHKKGITGIFSMQPGQGEVIFVRPKYTDRRYQNQKSVFSCHKDPYKEIELKGLQKIEFSGHLKPTIRVRLRSMGVSTSFIYPGLGGIASEAKSFHFDPVTSGRLKILTASAVVKL